MHIEMHYKHYEMLYNDCISLLLRNLIFILSYNFIIGVVCDRCIGH